MLTDLIRTHKGASDESYPCVTQEEDEEGKLGVSLSKDLITVARRGPQDQHYDIRAESPPGAGAAPAPALIDNTKAKQNEKQALRAKLQAGVR